MKFDAVRFLSDHFGTPHGVLGLFGAYGFACPPYDTVRKWFARGSVPAEWLPFLIAVAELDGGKPLRLAPYIVREDCIK